MMYSFTTADHPSALGRVPQDGDEGFVVHFPTDEGGMVSISMGRSALVEHASCIVAMLAGDPDMKAAVEDNLKHITVEDA